MSMVNMINMTNRKLTRASELLVVYRCTFPIAGDHGRTDHGVERVRGGGIAVARLIWHLHPCTTSSLSLPSLDIAHSLALSA